MAADRVVPRPKRSATSTQHADQLFQRHRRPRRRDPHRQGYTAMLVHPMTDHDYSGSLVVDVELRPRSGCWPACLESHEKRHRDATGGDGRRYPPRAREGRT